MTGSLYFWQDISRGIDVTNPEPVAVREQRRICGITQADLASAVGVSRQTVISIERGEHAPSVYLALRIARVLGESVEALFPLPEKEYDHVR